MFPSSMTRARLSPLMAARNRYVMEKKDKGKGRKGGGGGREGGRGGNVCSHWRCLVVLYVGLLPKNQPHALHTPQTNFPWSDDGTNKPAAGTMWTINAPTPGAYTLTLTVPSPSPAFARRRRAAPDKQDAYVMLWNDSKDQILSHLASYKTVHHSKVLESRGRGGWAGVLHAESLRASRDRQVGRSQYSPRGPNRPQSDQNFHILRAVRGRFARLA